MRIGYGLRCLHRHAAAQVLGRTERLDPPWVRDVYKFGAYKIDPDTREIFRGTEAVQISAKAFDCLVYLIRHRERAVGRDELTAAVWGRADISDTQLNFTLFKARRAIGGGGSDSSGIRTIQRFGYRWVASISDDASVTASPVQLLTQGLADEQAAPLGTFTSASPHGAPGRNPVNRGGLFLKIGAVCTLAVVCVIGLRYAQQSQRTDLQTRGEGAALPGATSNTQLVAVLPARIESDGDEAWLRLGLMELISSRLRRASRSVVPSSNMAALGSADAPLEQLYAIVEKTTGAHTVVQPSVLNIGAAWTVRLEWRRSGESEEIEAHGTDVVAASRSATDNLLKALGDSTLPEPGMGVEQEEWFARVEGALLANNLNEARSLVDSRLDHRDDPDFELIQARLELAAGEPAAAGDRLKNLLLRLPVESAHALRVSALLELGTSMISQGDGDAAEPVYRELMPLLETSDDTDVVARAYKGRGAATALVGRTEDAAADFGRARIAYQTAGNALGVASVEYNEGLLYIMQDRPAEAVPVLTDSVERFKSVGSYDQLADAQYCLANTQIGLLQPVASLNVANETASYIDKVASQRRRAKLEYIRALALAVNGVLGDARRRFDAISNSSAPEEAPWLGLAQASIAILEFNAGHAQAALSASDKALTEITDPANFTARGYAWLAGIRARRELANAAEAARETSALGRWAASSSDPSLSAIEHMAEAEQAWADHDERNAIRLHDASLHDAKRTGSPSMIANVVNSYAKALIDAGRFEEAVPVVGQVSRWASLDFACALSQVRLYHALNQPAAWQAALQQARALAGERSIPAELTRLPGEQPIQ